MPIATVNPATGRAERMFLPAEPAELERCVDDADRTFAELRATTFATRATWLLAAADILDHEADSLAALVTGEMGKTLAAAAEEVARSAATARWYAEHAEAFLVDEPQADPRAVCAYTRWSARGPLLADGSWEFPVWQVMRFAAPALLAGDVVLLRPAPNVPRTALLLADLFARAGFPKAAFQTLLVESDAIENVPLERQIFVTERASESFIVLPSADLERAAKIAVAARCHNNGQSPIAARRFIVHRDVSARFQELFVAKMAELVVGDPVAERTDIGPLATETGRAAIDALVTGAIADGATVLCGGRRPDGPGWYYPPTVLTGVNERMRIFHDDVPGPFAQLYEVPDIDAAIRLANATRSRADVSVWTDEESDRRHCVADLVAGAVYVNGIADAYPEPPLGRIREFCDVQTVWIGPS